MFLCFKVSSSDEEGTSSGMDKLVKSLQKLTKLVVESLKCADISKQSGIVQTTTMN